MVSHLQVSVSEWGEFVPVAHKNSEAVVLQGTN